MLDARPAESDLLMVITHENEDEKITKGSQLYDFTAYFIIDYKYYRIIIVI